MKYQILKEVEKYDWKEGEIVEAIGSVADRLVEEGTLELYTGEEPNKHLIIEPNPIKLTGTNQM